MKKIRIVSDGIPNNTKIYDAETGEQISGARSIKYAIDIHNAGIATIEIVCPQCEIECEACFEHKELFSDDELSRIRNRKNKIVSKINSLVDTSTLKRTVDISTLGEKYREYQSD